MKDIHKMDARDLCELLPRVKHRCMQLGLILTGQALERAVQEVGWEHAAQMARARGGARAERKEKSRRDRYQRRRNA